MIEPLDVQVALQGTALEGRAVQTVPVLDTGELGFQVDIEGLEWLPVWRTARDACTPLGLWPLFGCAEPPGSGNTYSRSEFPGVGDQTPSAILERAATLSWPEARPFTGSWGERWPEIVKGAVEQTQRRVGDAPDAEDLLRRVTPQDDIALERELLQWEEARQPTRSQEPAGHFDEVYIPYYESAIALLPTSCAWAAPAYVYYVGARGPEELVCAARSWHQRYGATPWAIDACVIHFVVEQPIQTISEAFDVASEMLPFYKWDHSCRALARALFQSGFWELYDRP